MLRCWKIPWYIGIVWESISNNSAQRISILSFGIFFTLRITKNSKKRAWPGAAEPSGVREVQVHHGQGWGRAGAGSFVSTSFSITPTYVETTHIAASERHRHRGRRESKGENHGLVRMRRILACDNVRLIHDLASLSSREFVSRINSKLPTLAF